MDKKRAHRNSDKSKNSKFMPDLIPSQNHQWNIDCIKSNGNWNGKADKATTQSRDNLRQARCTT